ncbi:SEC10/PgrA surface exclusion domain-containing protein [Streptococcus sp. oral taxon 431]|uniref:SEC10/PgrA surface exclusion domain-containing protein n=1 Tax=Streptococcus sp. oral taxon 431 TaxID=712633 RepID=UPI002005CB55|nr:SEC10/PgrA surface exclusion domain-containing protein [Streptococcus sp. oral taxon 431]
MLESNTQGHGTIKKLRNGMVVSTLALTAFGVSSGVSASETEVAVNEPVTKVVAKDEVKPKVPTQQDIDTAKAESDKANQDVAKQKEVVSTTEATIANAEKSIAETNKKVEEAKSVTPEKVAEAKADAEKKANELATAEKTVADADKSVSATAEKVADQTKLVSNAEKTATATANKVADAQKKVDSLSSTTDVAPLEKEVVTLTNQVSEDTQAVETAQTNLDNGKKAQSNKDLAIKDAQTGVSNAESNLSQATTALATAKADQSNKDKAVTSAKADLDRAKEELADVTAGQYTISLGSEYVALLKEYFANPTKELSEKLKALAFKEYEKFGKITFEDGEVYRYDLTYPQASKKDQNTKVDINNLDFETRKELSVFAADLINQIRKQFGTKDVVVTEDAIRIANEIARKSTEEYGHDFKALNEVGKDNGVLLGELAGFSDDTTTTLADVKERIYDDILSMLFNDAHAKWGHATSLSGVLPKDKYAGYMQYTGLGFRSNATFTSVIHYIKISDNVVSDGAKFDKTKVISAPSTAEKIANLQEKLSTAQSTYDNTVKSSQEAKTSVQSAQTAYTNAETALANARTHLSDLLGNKIDVPSLEKALADAQYKLAQDTKALQTAKEVLTLAKSNATDKAKALAEAKIALANAKTEQSTADQSLETAKGELEVLTKAQDVAVLARKSAGEDLFRKREASKEATDTYTVLELALTKRDEVLKALEAELTDANAKLGVLRAELETAKKELARLEGIAEAKARGYENFKQLKADHDAYLAEQQRLQALKDKEDAIRNAGGEVKPVLDANGKVVDVVDAKAQNKPVNVAIVGTKDDKTYQAPAQATNAKAESKKQLPNTGTKGSMLGLLGLGLLAGLGLGYTKKNLRK